MASLDIDSIFISIPLNKTIFDIFIDNLYKDDENTPKIPWVFFSKFAQLSHQRIIFILNNKFYKQIDGVALGSSFGQALGKTFMCSFENKCLKIALMV